MPRTILVHLNIEVPEGPLDGLDADAFASEVKGALEVGTDPEQTPGLAGSEVAVALAEDIG